MNETPKNTCERDAEPRVVTVGEHLDKQIARLRRQLEEACITKAKAEAAQLLNVPMEFIWRCTSF